jgi:hypothetical protein
MSGMSLTIQTIKSGQDIPAIETFQNRSIEQELNTIDTKPASTQLTRKSVKACNADKEVEKNLARSVVDAFLLRAAPRLLETYISNPVLRAGYRFVTEIGRKNIESVFVNYLERKPFTAKDFKIGLSRAFEHVPATLVLEPNTFNSPVLKILAGLGNMGVRFAARLGLPKADVANPVAPNGVMNDFFSRSVFRIFSINSDNSLIGFLSRGFEQLFINLDLHVFKSCERAFPNTAKTITKLLK